MAFFTWMHAGANGKTKDDILKALYKGVKDVHCIPETMQNLTTHGPFLSASEIFYNKGES